MQRTRPHSGRLGHGERLLALIGAPGSSLHLACREFCPPCAPPLEAGVALVDRFGGRRLLLHLHPAKGEIVIRKLHIWLAALAVAALSATAASSAWAVEFHYSSEHTILSGEQVGSVKFSVGSGFGSITCSVVKFSGTAAAKTATSEVLTPTYEGCKDSLGRRVDTTNSSTMTETTPAQATGGATTHFTGEMTTTITDANGNPICHVVEKTQSLPGTVQHASGVKRLLTIILGEIKTTTSGGFFNCGVSNGEHTSGTYEGEVLLSGTDTAGNPVELRLE
jgi:hypothetical protein